MDRCQKKNQQSEKILENRRTKRNASLTAKRYYVSFFATRKEDYLVKALNHSIATLNNHPWDLPSLFLVCYLYIEVSAFDKAQELLDCLVDYRNYLKKHDEENYCYYLFLCALLDIRAGYGRGYKKFLQWRKRFINDEFLDTLALVSGILEFETGNYEVAEDYFYTSFSEKNYQTLLFIYLYRLMTLGKQELKKEVLVPVISWALNKGFDLAKVVENNIPLFHEEALLGIHFYQRVYDQYPFPWLLQMICRKRMEDGATDLSTYFYFKEGEEKQQLHGALNDYYIQLAYIHKKEHFKPYAITSYLRKDKMEPHIQEFLYYIIVTQPQYKQLSAVYKNSILQFIAFGLENKIRTRYYYNLYCYFLTTIEKNTNNAKLLQLCEDLLVEEIFAYSVETTDEEVKILWVFEKLKNKVNFATFVDNKASFEAFSGDFEVFCMDQNGQKVFTDGIAVEKKVRNVTMDIWLHFYHIGVRSENLMLAIANEVIGQEKIEVKYLDILIETLKYKSLSLPFRTKINSAIGSIFNSENEHDRALNYYLEVDENHLDDRFVEPMLMVFLHGKVYEKAMQLIQKKETSISDKVLFFAVKELYKENKFHPLLANLSYHLLLKTWYDKILIEIVVSFFKGSERQWSQLSKVLSSVSEDAIKIDERILKNSIRMKIYNIETQKVFKRVCEQSPQSPILKDFVYFTAYKVLVEHYMLDYQTIYSLEKIYGVENDRLLAYALSYLYIEKGIGTTYAMDITKAAVRYAEEEDMLLPHFKSLKDKNLITPYIEKNQPFSYRANPNRKILLYYRFQGEAVFRKKQMKYFRFGLYYANLVVFYGERMEYYYQEQIGAGSIDSSVEVFENNKIPVISNGKDLYFSINDACIQEKMLKYEKIFELLEHEVVEPKNEYRLLYNLE